MDTALERMIWEALEAVKDPEIPVVSVVDLGIIRRIETSADGLRVTITPTYSGCPALEVMKRDIVRQLRSAGFGDVEVRTQLNPPWTTDWLTDRGRRRLTEFGISPPRVHAGSFNVVLLEAVPCPYCGSESTEEKNAFGPTACKAIFFCSSCRQPFERFKPI